MCLPLSGLSLYDAIPHIVLNEMNDFFFQGYQWILTRGQDASRQRGSYSPVPKKVLHFNSFLCTTVRMQNYYGLEYLNLIGVMWVFVKD